VNSASTTADVSVFQIESSQERWQGWMEPVFMSTSNIAENRAIKFRQQLSSRKHYL